MLIHVYFVLQLVAKKKCIVICHVTLRNVKTTYNFNLVKTETLLLIKSYKEQRLLQLLDGRNNKYCIPY